MRIEINRIPFSLLECKQFIIREKSFFVKRNNMGYYALKVLISSVLIVLISEVSKRSTLFGALLASIPFVSLFAFFWLYHDTKNVQLVSSLSTSIFWLVLPSLALFIALPLLLKQGINFYLSLGLASIITMVCYGLLIVIMNYFRVEL